MFSAQPVLSTQAASETVVRKAVLFVFVFLSRRSCDVTSYSVSWSLGWSQAKHGVSSTPQGLAHLPPETEKRTLATDSEADWRGSVGSYPDTAESVPSSSDSLGFQHMVKRARERDLRIGWFRVYLRLETLACRS